MFNRKNPLYFGPINQYQHEGDPWDPRLGGDVNDEGPVCTDGESPETDKKK